MASQRYNFELNIEWMIENNFQKCVRGAEHVWGVLVCTGMPVPGMERGARSREGRA